MTGLSHPFARANRFKNEKREEFLSIATRSPSIFFIYIFVGIRRFRGSQPNQLPNLLALEQSSTLLANVLTEFFNAPVRPFLFYVRPEALCIGIQRVLHGYFSSYPREFDQQHAERVGKCDRKLPAFQAFREKIEPRKEQ